MEHPFSYICKGCNKPINYKKESIEDTVVLYLLQRGKVLETIRGYYNGRGCTQEHTWKTSKQLVYLLHTTPDLSNGVAAYHYKCDPANYPVERSLFDPNRGRDLPEKQYILSQTYHQVFRHINLVKLDTDRNLQNKVFNTVIGGVSGLIEKTDQILHLLV